MLNFASQEFGGWLETNQTIERISISDATPTSKTVKILADKIVVPLVSAEIQRPRLFAHLEKSLRHYSAALVTGRTGTGKTAFAADFARASGGDVAWYKADTTDTDWKVFLGYLSESLSAFKSDAAQCRLADAAKNERFFDSGVSLVTESLAAEFSAVDAQKPLLVVLDDLHSVFDAEWFDEFFNALLSLPTENVHLLLLARTAPPFPLWRMRSKQVLDVIDEKMLAFNVDETVELFQKYKLSKAAARAAHKRVYGKVGALLEICREKTGG